LLQNCTSGFMVVEEVDSAQVSLKDDVDVVPKNDGKNVGRALFWQWLSGNVPHSNSVIFLTTNHIDRLDPGLLRDARVDISVYVGRWGVAELQRYLAMQFTDRPPLWFNSLGSLKRTESAKDEEMPVGSAIQALVDKTTPEHVLEAVCQKYPVTYDRE
jgi:SpoVK/Ycf46/Vps4 family AAA+-type ATPase